ncbi:MAG: hypothetical protein HWN67_07950 [Candidatus Helarchaeota archaeon]|nr:hypothetical protein [Candidatus Helarchaeota archaeon]
MSDIFKVRASFSIKTGFVSKEWIFGRPFLAAEHKTVYTKLPGRIFNIWTPAIEGELSFKGSIIVFKIDYPINFVKKVLNIPYQDLKSYGELILSLDLNKSKKIKKRYGYKEDRRIEIHFKPHGELVTKKSKQLEFNIISQNKRTLDKIYIKLLEAKAQRTARQDVGKMEIILD